MIVKITNMLGLLAFFLVSGCNSDINRSAIYKKTNTTCSAINPMQCSNRQLCNSLNIMSMKVEARTRALACVQQLNSQQPELQKSKIANIVVVTNSIEELKTPSKSDINNSKTSNITKSIEDELKRIGCNVGKADGIIDDKTRAGLYSFTSKVGMNFDLKVLNDINFLELIKTYPAKTCPKNATSTTTTVKKPSSVANSNTDNSAALSKLKQERVLLEKNLLATQQLFEQQKRAAERPYKACLASCLLNNKAGKGFSAAFSGMAQCNSSCAPLKWGGAVVPPSWEQNKKRLQTINCDIMRLSKNHISANCR